MNTENSSLIPWTPDDSVTIPAEARSPDAIVKYGMQTLSDRDMSSIVSGFESRSFEMVSTFVWSKAIATLKRQMSKLGMEFVGEMLGRPDLNETSNPATSIGDHEAIALAEDLGMITTIQALRLKQALQLVTHFSSAINSNDPDDAMQYEEALALLRNCMVSILGKPSFETAIQFVAFRKRLTESSLRDDDADLKAIASSPYFFIRTTLSVLLAAVKTGKSAMLEHAIGNTALMLPKLWHRLREPEKWQVGQAYAETNAAGNTKASSGLRRALMSVAGFDYVPESLRSSTYTEAAANVLATHFAFNNFYNEQEPMEALAALGTTVPRPAFGKVMEAALAVRLGNTWGRAFAAQDAALRIITGLRQTQWHYYFDHCLPSDRTVLDKISTSSDTKPIKNWCELIQSIPLGEYNPRSKLVRQLLAVSNTPGAPTDKVAEKARALRDHVEK